MGVNEGGLKIKGGGYGEQKCHHLNLISWATQKKKHHGIDLFDRMSGMSGHGLDVMEIDALQT